MSSNSVHRAAAWTCAALLMLGATTGCTDDEGGEGAGGSGAASGGSTASSSGSGGSTSSSSGNGGSTSSSSGAGGALDPALPMADDTHAVFLHHSTGGVIWGGGVSDWIGTYNSNGSKAYQVTERAFPDSPYPWQNYPYDYWHLWIDGAGPDPVEGQDTLEILAPIYPVIVFKHCFPVSHIVADSGAADVTSAVKSIENYQLQYAALKDKLHSFPQNRFIVWTGAALIEAETNAEEGARARQFFQWVKDSWDEPGDNIYLWDFFELETEGGNYLLPAYSAGDSHPNDAFAQQVAPLFGQRLVDVIEGRGDSGSLTGE